MPERTREIKTYESLLLESLEHRSHLVSAVEIICREAGNNQAEGFEHLPPEARFTDDVEHSHDCWRCHGLTVKKGYS